jgi:hypothetical protein
MCGAFAAVTDVLFLEHLSFVFDFFLRLRRAQEFHFSPYRIELLRYFAKRVPHTQPPHN